MEKQQFAGVFPAKKKDGTEYYRASITFAGKHISLGSFTTPQDAAAAYAEANDILHQPVSRAVIHASSLTTTYQATHNILAFSKWVILVNFRDNGIYSKSPIYLLKKYFIYFLSPEVALKFDVDDLFYYSNHPIIARNGYLYVNEYGMQTNILSRYGIHNFAVCGRDYDFANNDHHDFRYGNIIVINPYFGVQRILRNGRTRYKVRIHITGDYVVGTYPTETEAAVAYNKAADILRSKGVQKEYPSNYIEELSPIEYAKLYNHAKISARIREFPSLIEH